MPDGFRHTFLIRRPVKSIPSFYTKFESAFGSKLASKALSYEVSFRKIWELYQYIRDVKGQTPLVIDADDLLSDPATMMKKYCDSVGFEFNESMLHWETGLVDDWIWDTLWYRTVSSSTGFIKPTETETSASEIDVSSFPEFIQDIIRDSQFYYEELYKLRIKP